MGILAVLMIGMVVLILAEVVLRNDEHRAPAPFTQSELLEVSRRIEREAGSVYRINGREVRARDVHMLFADASTGARSPALVHQGRIGEIIQARPDQRRRVLEDEREPLWEDAGSELQPGGLLQRAWERLRELAEQVGRFGLGRRLYAAISVRYIYANVIRLAEQRGFPRPPARTPNEFLPTLAQAFPGHEADLAQITEAYVKVHYGELPTDWAELEELRAGWERLRQVGS
jgi:hypothetical protein